jgi:uncharacterized protein (DUF488 family)
MVHDPANARRNGSDEQPQNSEGGTPEQTIHIFTIGFTKKSAEDFFGKLGNSGVKRLIDVRLNNVSQLAGFTKKDDLRFFLRQILGIDYLHLLERCLIHIRNAKENGQFTKNSSKS